MKLSNKLVLSIAIGTGLIMSSPVAFAYTKQQAENWCKRHSSCSKRNGEKNTAYYDGDKLKFDCPLKGNGNCVILYVPPQNSGDHGQSAPQNNNKSNDGGSPGGAPGAAG